MLCGTQRRDLRAVDAGQVELASRLALVVEKRPLNCVIYVYVVGKVDRPRDVAVVRHRGSALGVPGDRVGDVCIAMRAGSKQ